MAEYNSFTYDEIKSSDFGVYIGGEKTFDAPSLRGQSIEIPGRNGNVFISSDSYENVELVYPSFNFEPDLETFRSKLAKLRNALSSRASYKRLTDTLHPDEFRMAVFRDGFEVKPIKYNTAAEFDIVFDCKPQRFLKSGEIPVEYTPGQTPSDEQTKTGSIVTFEAEEGTIISDVKADINPVQDLHGYDKPWAGGTGKNLLPNLNNNSVTINGLTFTKNSDGSVTVNGTNTSSGTTSYYLHGTRSVIPLLREGNYRLTGSPSGGGSLSNLNWFMSLYYDNNGSNNWGKFDFGDGQTYELTNGRNTGIGCRIGIGGGKTVNNQTFYPMLRLASETDASFEPYENICPISGWDSVKVTRTGRNLVAPSGLRWGFYGRYGEWITESSNHKSTDMIPVKSNTKYISAVYNQDNSEVNSLVWSEFDENKRFVTQKTTKNITTGATTRFVVARNYNDQISLINSGNFSYKIEEAETDSGFIPYDGEIYTINLNGTRYGGTLDATNGLLTCTKQHILIDENSGRFSATNNRYLIDLATGEWAKDANSTLVISDYFDGITYSQAITNGVGVYARNSLVGICGFKASLAEYKAWLADNPVTVVYELATPITVQLTPTEVKTLLGVNNVWADSGDITVKYGTSPYIIVNPTDFPSKPLLEVTGVGSFWLGDTQITITGTSGQIIYIDCETGECYKVTGGIISPANGLVTLNRLDFPKLASGINNIQLGAGISKVKITPRWWRL